MYNKLPVKERIELMKSYRKANKDMSYHDMVKDYNDSYQKFENGGKYDYLFDPNKMKGPYKDAPLAFPKKVTGIDDNLLTRQLYKESRFNPNAVSPVGAMGIAQIMPKTRQEAVDKGIIKSTDDVKNPEIGKKLQERYMSDLYNSSFINKPTNIQDDSVRLAKTLAGYNWGRGNLISFLNNEKNKGVDIYKSYDWVEHLPKETKNYVNSILLKKDNTFEKDFEKASKNFKYRK